MTERAMDAYICVTCGVQQAPADRPPARCPICEDERQYVRQGGQAWTTLGELKASGHRIELRDLEPGLVGVGIEPSFGIGQRALLVQTADGNFLWDCIGYIDDEAVEAIRSLGGIAGTAMSHPHFYGALLVGDTITVVQDVRFVSFMRSYPNRIPLPASEVRKIVKAIRPFPFDRVYGGWWDRVMATGGIEAVERSARRYLRWIGAPERT